MEYFTQITPGAFLRRVGMGFAETTFHLADAMALASPRPGCPLHILWVAAGLASAVVALRWLWRQPRAFARTFHLVHAAWTYAFLIAYNASAGSARYFLPLVATTLAPSLAAQLVAWLERAREAARTSWMLRGGGVWAAAVGTTLVFSPVNTQKPGLAEVQNWLLQRLRPGDVYAVDARTLLHPQWLVPWAEEIIVSASWREKPVPLDELMQYLRQNQVRFVVLDGSAKADMANSDDPEGRRYLFYDYLPLEPDGSLPLDRFPGGLRPVYVDAGRPRRWMVLETPWVTSRAQTD
jgi:hypothetical protein